MSSRAVALALCTTRVAEKISSQSNNTVPTSHAETGTTHRYHTQTPAPAPVPHTDTGTAARGELSAAAPPLLGRSLTARPRLVTLVTVVAPTARASRTTPVRSPPPEPSPGPDTPLSIQRARDTATGRGIKAQATGDRRGLRWLPRLAVARGRNLPRTGCQGSLGAGADHEPASPGRNWAETRHFRPQQSRETPARRRHTPVTRHEPWRNRRRPLALYPA